MLGLLPWRPRQAQGRARVLIGLVAREVMYFQKDSSLRLRGSAD